MYVNLNLNNELCLYLWDISLVLMFLMIVVIFADIFANPSINITHDTSAKRTYKRLIVNNIKSQNSVLFLLVSIISLVIFTCLVFDIKSIFSIFWPNVLNCFKFVLTSVSSYWNKTYLFTPLTTIVLFVCWLWFISNTYNLIEVISGIHAELVEKLTEYIISLQATTHLGHLVIDQYLNYYSTFFYEVAVLLLFPLYLFSSEIGGENSDLNENPAADPNPAGNPNPAANPNPGGNQIQVENLENNGGEVLVVDVLQFNFVPNETSLRPAMEAAGVSLQDAEVAGTTAAASMGALVTALGALISASTGDGNMQEAAAVWESTLEVASGDIYESRDVAEVAVFECEVAKECADPLLENALLSQQVSKSGGTAGQLVTDWWVAKAEATVGAVDALLGGAHLADNIAQSAIGEGINLERTGRELVEHLEGNPLAFDINAAGDDVDIGGDDVVEFVNEGGNGVGIDMGDEDSVAMGSVGSVSVEMGSFESGSVEMESVGSESVGSESVGSESVEMASSESGSV